MGVAVEVLFQLLPWSLGLMERVDVPLSRTLSCYFGHAPVYFWLLPAYMSWYIVIPKVIGGHIFSDALARLSYCLGNVSGILWGTGMLIMSLSMHLAVLKNFRIRGVILVALVAFAYTAPIIEILSNSPAGPKGFPPW